MPLGFAHLASYPISAMALPHSGEVCACFLPPSGRSPSSACVTPASIRDDAARTRANLRPRLTARDRAPRPSAPAPSPLLPSAPCPPAGRPATFPDPLPPRSRLPWSPPDQFANETTGSTGTVNQLIGKAVKAVLARLRLRPTSHVERHLTTPEPRPAVPAAASNLHATNPGGNLAQPSRSEALKSVSAQAMYIVTRNVRDYRRSPIRAITPQDALDELS